MIGRIIAQGIAVGLLAFVEAGGAQNIDNPASRVRTAENDLPFILTWVRGSCSSCRTARNLSDVQFVSHDEAWAIGFTHPGETGTGDYSVLRTRDGGKTWIEIPEPWQHNATPTISFASQHDGWLRDVDIGAAEDRLLLTRDGGVHWRRLPMRDLFVHDVQLLGGGIGFGDGYDIYEKQGYLIVTKDDGWHWSKSLLPKGFSGELMDFADSRHGLIAGCLGRQVVVVGTSDAGARWKASELNLPNPDAKIFDNCVFEPDSLEFMDAKRGWLLTSRHSFGLHETEDLAVAWSTIDGGTNWRPIYREAFSVDDEQVVGLHFMDASLGYLWKYRTVGNRETNVMLYTTNGGQSWSRLDLPHVIWGCRQYQNEMECAGGENGYWILRIGPKRLNSWPSR